MLDIAHHLQATQREVAIRRESGSAETVAVVLRRTYAADVDDVWNAVTDPERVRRWFMPLTGDLREGGDFQLEGNAGGRILACEPPSRLRVTFGGPDSVVELRLTQDGVGGTVFELDHEVPLEMAGSGAGALFVGPGWDGAFLAIGLYLAGEVADDPVAAANSTEAQEFSRASVFAWVAVVEESGTADVKQIQAGKEMGLAQFAPELADPPAQD
jgi:uncharacterized protein YndB with AHSA1/START domain